MAFKCEFAFGHHALFDNAHNPSVRTGGDDYEILKGHQNLHRLDWKCDCPESRTNPSFGLSARVSEKVCFFGDWSEKLPYSVLLDPIEPKPFCEVADQNHFRCAG